MSNILDVSIIIVNYNTKKLLQSCLSSIFEQTKGILFEVIVSDNGSIDGSIEMIRTNFPKVTIIENNANLGFGAANNLGLKAAKGKYIFYLNSDTILLNNAIKIFFDYWETSVEKERIGTLGAMLLDSKLNFNTSYGNLPTAANELKYLRNCFLSSLYIKTIYSKFHKVNQSKEFYGEVGYVMGADLFLRNDKNAKFDERYFMFYEESDLQYFLKKENKKNLIIKGPKIIHLEGGSDNRSKLVYNFNNLTSIYYWESCILYLNKNSTDFKIVKKIFNRLKLIYLLPWNFSKSKIAIKKFRNAMESYKC